MPSSTFDELYRDAPPEQREMLREFRLSHPYQHLTVNGVEWEYIASGQGDQAHRFASGGHLASFNRQAEFEAVVDGFLAAP
jgi:hypothetical protein